jgi:hypothetical protein
MPKGVVTSERRKALDEEALFKIRWLNDGAKHGDVLGAIEARAEAATLAFVDLKRWQGSNLPPLANLIKDTAIELAATAADVPTLVAELRAAREVVEAAQEVVEQVTFPSAGGIQVHLANGTLLRRALTAQKDALAAYRAVVGEA